MMMRDTRASPGYWENLTHVFFSPHWSKNVEYRLSTVLSRSKTNGDGDRLSYWNHDEVTSTSCLGLISDKTLSSHTYGDFPFLCGYVFTFVIASSGDGQYFSNCMFVRYFLDRCYLYLKLCNKMKMDDCTSKGWAWTEHWAIKTSEQCGGVLGYPTDCCFDTRVVKSSHQKSQI